MAHSASSRTNTSRASTNGGKTAHADHRASNGHTHGRDGADRHRHSKGVRNSRSAGAQRSGNHSSASRGARSRHNSNRNAAAIRHDTRPSHSPRTDRHPGPCPIKQACGGCEWIGIPYRKQLARKQSAMEELFGPIIEREGWSVRIAPIVGMEPGAPGSTVGRAPAGPSTVDSPQPSTVGDPDAPDTQTEPGQARTAADGARPPRTPLGYRHKAASPFAPGPHGAIESGFFARGTHRIVACPACAVEAAGARHILNETATIASRLGIAAYDEDRRCGLVRYAVVRMGWRTDEAMLTLVTASRIIPRASELVEQLRGIDSRIVTIAQNINTRQTNAILGGETRILYGAERMRDRLLGCTFEISPTSFYQTNPQQTEALYQLAIDGLELQTGDTLIDAYCGSGTIGLAAADAARTRGATVELIGIERNASGVRDARRNAQINDLEGTAHFIAADATAYLQRAAADGMHADTLIMDPPRAGSTSEFITAACAIGPRRIAYISCNPVTQARDLADFARGGYHLRALTPVDMFPHTSHTETVAILERA